MDFPTGNPSMKYVTLPLCFCALSLYGQSVAPSTPKPAEVGPDTVLLKAGNHPVTAAEFEKILGSFPENIQQTARKNPRQVMQSYFLMQMLTHQAEQEKVDQTSPVKEQLELQRMQSLATTMVNRHSDSI